MWIILAVALAVAWVVCFVGFHVAGAAIHVLLVLAVISAIVHFVAGSTHRTRTT